MHTQKTEIVGLDLEWKILIHVSTKLEVIPLVDFLPFSMDMVAVKYLTTALKEFLKNLEKKFQRNL